VDLREILVAQNLSVEATIMETGVVLFLFLVVVYTLIANSLGRFSITMPMIFVSLGALAGSRGLGVIQFSLTAPDIEILTEITLALLLFADAATLDLRQVRGDANFPARLLLIGMPLIILLGSVAAFILFPEERVGFSLLVATILAPTDAALGLAIFNNPRVPVRIRRALNVESGLNDGIASPLVILFIALTLEELGHVGENWIASALTEIAIGAGLGALIGLAGGWLFRTAVEKDWTSNVARQIGNPALALFVFFGAKLLHGNGFVAVFAAGILFGYVTRHLLHEATEYTEISGTLMSVFVWTIFGATLVIPLLRNFNSLAFVYALLSLTVVRIVPVSIAMIRTGLRLDTKLMMGWLGPRGLASVVFMLIAYEAGHEAQVPMDNLMAMAGWTILLSVMLHGISALPLANWYARRLESADADAPELVQIRELRTKRRKPFSFPLNK
jgi:NhaP-type Na+/H+ or K+/H+ antiporter